MTHETLQFATRIALRGVLHRGTSRVIHRCRSRLSFHWDQEPAASTVPLARGGKRDGWAAACVFNKTLLLLTNDPSAGSPTETLLRLLIPLAKLA